MINIDGTCVDQFYWANAPAVRSAIRANLYYPDRDLVRDLEQDVYVRLLTYPILQTYDASRSTPSTYMASIINNVVHAWYTENHMDATWHPGSLAAIQTETEDADYTVKDRIYKFRQYINNQAPASWRKSARKILNLIIAGCDDVAHRCTTDYWRFRQVRTRYLRLERTKSYLDGG